LVDVTDDIFGKHITGDTDDILEREFFPGWKLSLGKSIDSRFNFHYEDFDSEEEWREITELKHNFIYPIILKDYKKITNSIKSARTARTVAKTNYKSNKNVNNDHLSKDFLNDFLLLFEPIVAEFSHANPVALFHYLFQLEMCTTILLGQLDSSSSLRNLETKHHDLLRNLGEINEKDCETIANYCPRILNLAREPQSEEKKTWENVYYQSPIFSTNLSTNQLDEWTSFKFPKDILSIILEYDRISGERMLECEDLIYSRLTFSEEKS
jgi:hypothetical protein